PARRVTTRRRHGGRAVDRHRADREDVGEAGVHPLRPVDGERHHEEIVAVAREDRRIKTLLDPWSTGSAAWPAPRPAPNLPTFAGASTRRGSREGVCALRHARRTPTRPSRDRRRPGAAAGRADPRGARAG